MKTEANYKNLFNYLVTPQNEANDNLSNFKNPFGELSIHHSENDLAKCLTSWIWHNEQNENTWNYLKNNQDAYALNYDKLLDFIFISQYSSSTIERALSCRYSVKIDPEKQLEVDVIKLFKDILEVQCIYTDNYLNRKRFLIMTSNSKYDDVLMEKLLDIEINLKLSKEDLLVTFEYIPRTLQSDSEIIAKNAKVIYERGFDVLFTGAYLASTAEQATSTATI